MTVRGTPVARQSVARSVGRERAREVEARADDGRAGHRRGGRERGDHARDVLVGHRRGDERDRARLDERPEVVERGRQGGRAGRVMGAVEQHVPVPGPEQLQAARPDGIGISAAARVVGDGRDARRLERIERRVGDGRVGGLVPAAQSDPRPAEAWQLDVDAVAVPADGVGAGSTSVSGTAIRRARRRMTARPSPRAPVTARSPRSMIAAFSRAIFVIVSPSRSM